MKHPITRRDFLGTTALAGGATALGADNKSKPIATRVLGKTGVNVTILAMGCGSRLLSYQRPDDAIAALNLALDLGIGYLDTAYGYGQGKSETWVGEVMKTRRKEVFLATKIEPRNGDQAMRILEGTLKRLQTDQVDLIHVHSLTTEDDLAQTEAKDGVLNVLYKLRDQKVTRFIGITSHSDPEVLKTAIERHDIDCTQMALNPAMQGFTGAGGSRQVFDPSIKTSFEMVALPAARKKNLGIIGMKVMAQEALLEPGPRQKDPARLLQYTLSLPVAAAVVGMPKPDFIRQNVAAAKAFRPMPESEMQEFSRQTAREYKAELDHKFRDHVDA